MDLPYHHHSVSRQTTILTVDSVTAKVIPSPNNLFGSDYGYPFDGGYGNAGAFNSGGSGQNNFLQVNVQ